MIKARADGALESATDESSRAFASLAQSDVVMAPGGLRKLFGFNFGEIEWR